jgi:arabinogalactan oligomer/maltooligosaccharide transport system permease protein
MARSVAESRNVGQAHRVSMRRRWVLVALLLVVAGCQQQDNTQVITVWHQSRPIERQFLLDEIKEFEKAYNRIHDTPVHMRALYKETEELRSGFQAAALAGGGPELIYGPSDVPGTFQAMGVVRDMAPWFSETQRRELIDGALTYLPTTKDPSQRALVQIADRFGNHLALVYNRQFIKEPPKTTDELIELAVKNTTRESTQDGTEVTNDKSDRRYGLVWNFTEPFFGIPFLTGFGGWVFAESPDANLAEHAMAKPVPALDTPEAIAGWEFMQSLRLKHGVTPQNCDYEMADLLFKTGRAAMIINGDWSWADYLETPGIDAAVAVLPVVTATGQPMRTMFAPKGFSLNAKIDDSKAALAMEFVQHMVGPEAQRRLVEKLRMLPARKSAQTHSLFETDETLRASQAQLKNGRLMPPMIELRAIWDGMKPSYQGILSGALTPAEAAAKMQRDSLRNIDVMQREFTPGPAVATIQLLGGLLIVALIFWQRHSFLQFFRDLRRNTLAYVFALPAVFAIFTVVVYPFVYNIFISFSNMSLAHFQDAQLVGLQNYIELFTDPEIAPKFWYIFGMTILWTVVNVAFHVGLGLLLAVALNGPVRGKALYRVLLIIPWAVPAYITALTWRGMFDFEYGAVNLLLTRVAELPPAAWLLGLLGLTPPVNWLGDVTHAFQACIVANVWLGFPFMMVIALGGMQGIPHELYEAARIDRASRWQQFRHITLPLLKPVLLPAVTLGTIWTFNNLNVIWLVSNGGEPQDSTHILVSYVYKAAFNLYRYGYAAALSMIIFFMLLAFSIVFLWRTRATESVYG